MRSAFVIAGIFAVATALGPATALAKNSKGKNGIHASSSASVKAKAKNNGLRSLARADQVAGTHGLKGRDNARLHGANKPGFCPPGQAKKPGLGSRFQC